MKQHVLTMQLKNVLNRRPIKIAAIAAIVATLVLFAVVLGFWQPAARAHAQSAKALAETRRVVLGAKEAVEIERAYREAEKSVAQFERKLNTQGGQAALVQQLAQLAAQHQVKVISETYDEGKPRDGYTPLTLELHLQGRYEGLRGFLVQLSSLPQWIIVHDSVITRTDTADLKAQLRLQTFRRREGA